MSTIRTGYDRWSAVYDHDGNPLIALETPEVHRLVGDVAGLNVLDLGCGTGRHALWLAGAGAKVTAVDFSEGMLNEARCKPGADAVHFLQHDLHLALPFPNHTFDLVVSGLVMEHLKALDQFFVEAHRVLKPHGTAVISAMHPAMFLRGTQARFTDPVSGEIVQPGSYPHQISDFLTAALAADFTLEYICEKAPDADFVARYPRAEKYLAWPMLVVFEVWA